MEALRNKVIELVGNRMIIMASNMKEVSQQDLQTKHLPISINCLVQSIKDILTEEELKFMIENNDISILAVKHKQLTEKVCENIALYIKEYGK